jgi:uncharacterized integral membrane protein
MQPRIPAFAGMSGQQTEVATLLRRIVAAIILVPLAVLIIAFAVANREMVTVSFDPFSGHDPAATVSLPLFALIIALLIVGVVIGGMASWLRQGKWRGAARRFERELQVVRGKLAALEGMAESSEGIPRQASPPPRLKLKPPVH